MFTANFYIDTIQNSEKQFVNAVVQHEGVKKALNEFVDNQTVYTKSAVNATYEVSLRILEESTKAFADATKVDVTKFFKLSK
jgi:hypothetical protein